MKDFNHYINKGYTITGEANGIVTLTKQKSFNWFAFLFWLIFGFIGAFFYLIYYAQKKNKVVSVAK